MLRRTQVACGTGLKTFQVEGSEVAEGAFFFGGCSKASPT